MWNLTWSLVFLIVLLFLAMILLVISLYSSILPEGKINVTCTEAGGKPTSSFYYAGQKMKTTTVERNIILNVPGVEIDDSSEITFNTTAKMSYTDTNLTYQFTDISTIYQTASVLKMTRDNTVISGDTDLYLIFNVEYISTVFNNYYIDSTTSYVGSTEIGSGVNYVVKSAINSSGDTVPLSGDVVYVQGSSISPMNGWPTIVCRNLYSKMKNNNIVSITLELSGDLVVVANTLASI